MQYNALNYENRPVKFNDYIHDKYNKVHETLYHDALNKYLSYYIESVIGGKFTYRLFEVFTSYFNSNHFTANDEEIDITKILNYEKFNELSLSIINMDNIDEYILNANFINGFVEELYNDALIIKQLNKLELPESYQLTYIKYLFINIMYIMHKLKQSISDIDQLSNIISISSISDFIINYQNVTYIINEDNEIVALANEELYDDIILIGEQVYKEDIHIGYNEEGKWIIDLSDNIDLTNDELYSLLSTLITKTNYNVWKTLISNIKEIYVSNHRIIEVKNVEYWQPSSILIMTKHYPYNKQKIDLSKWWNNYQAYKDLKTTDLIATIDENVEDAAINYINYVQGKAKMYSKQHDKTYTVDLNYIKADTEVNDDNTLANTFTQKLKNIYN